jgi:hypothetical protein
MKIGIVTANMNFVSYIINELKQHHEVSLWLWNPKALNFDFIFNNFREGIEIVQCNEQNYKPSVKKFVEDKDLIYAEFIQLPLPYITGLDIDTPIVARMDGADIKSHIYIDWDKVSALVLPPVQYDRLRDMRRYHRLQTGNRYPPLPKTIIKTNVGIDVNAFQPDYARKPTYNIVFHSYSIREIKRVYTTIQTFYDLIQQDGDKPWKLILIGNYTHYVNRPDYLENIQELLEQYNFPEERLSIIPHNLLRKKWIEFISKQDVYWAASMRESFGASLAEAVASGVYPVVNCWRGAGYVYPSKYISRSPGEMVEHTIQWGKLSDAEKRSLRAEVRGVISRWDAWETAKSIRELMEELVQ